MQVKEEDTAVEARLLMADIDPPCIWFTKSRCKECCFLCVCFDMCIERWVTKHSLYCPLLFRIHYCSALIRWYWKNKRKMKREIKESRK